MNPVRCVKVRRAVANKHVEIGASKISCGNVPSSDSTVAWDRQPGQAVCLWKLNPQTSGGNSINKWLNGLRREGLSKILWQACGDGDLLLRPLFKVHGTGCVHEFRHDQIRMLYTQPQPLIAVVSEVDVFLCERVNSSTCANVLAGWFGSAIEIPVFSRKRILPVDNCRSHIERPASKVVVPLQLEASHIQIQQISKSDHCRCVRRHCCCVKCVECIANWPQQFAWRGGLHHREAKINVRKAKPVQPVGVNPVRIIEVGVAIAYKHIQVRTADVGCCHIPAGNSAVAWNRQPRQTVSLRKLDTQPGTGHSIDKRLQPCSSSGFSKVLRQACGQSYLLLRTAFKIQTAFNVDEVGHDRASMLDTNPQPLVSIVRNIKVLRVTVGIGATSCNRLAHRAAGRCWIACLPVNHGWPHIQWPATKIVVPLQLET